MTIWQTALLDPPWEERGSGKIKRGAQKHYPLLKTQDMPGVIRGSGLWTPDENAHVYCWVTNNFLPDGLWLLNELGARYITNIAWTKKRPGIGRYFRGKHELLLFATIGRGWAVRTAPNDIESALDTYEKDGDSYFPHGDAIEAEHEMVNGKRKHSAKPKVFYDMIESRSLGPYVEFFARSLRPGWTSWGNDEAVVAAVATAIPQTSSSTDPEPQPKKTRARRPEKSDKNGAQRSGEPAESDSGHRGNEPEMVSAATPESAEIGEVAPYVHIGKYMAPDTTAEEFFGPAHQHDHTCPCPACERERRVPRAFNMTVKEGPLPSVQGPGFLSQFKETFAEAEAAFLDGFPSGALHGGPTGHLPRPDPVPPPRPPSCPHGELRSACVLCRSRR